MCKRCPQGLAEALRTYTHQGVDLGDLGEVRRLLGPTLAQLPDAEIERIRGYVVAFGNAAFDWWMRERNAGLSSDPSHNFREDAAASSPP